MKHYLNPLNTHYPYQFNADPRKEGQLSIYREAADPSLICYRGIYYLFASMTLCVWTSTDLVTWESHPLPTELPLYDYAPDVRVIGDWVWFCASRRESNCDFYRTQDPLKGPYERIPGSFPFWDPNLFQDDDGTVYLYWGCSNAEPLYGVQLDANTMLPLGEPTALVFGHPEAIGYERVGEDNSISPATDEEIEARFSAFLQMRGITAEMLPEGTAPLIRGMFSNRPYVEGAWMTKHNGRYYLQYAAPGTQYNTYSDGVYVSDSPLGPFTLANNTPFSYNPGGFFPGAGHGSTMEDGFGNWWHTATMRISVNHDFERRVGLWPASFDEEGELFCNQRYGDWPIRVMESVQDPWQDPDWMLLSYNKHVTASSETEVHPANHICDENVRTWWTPKDKEDAWITLDLGKDMTVHAVQVNLADGHMDLPCPGEIRGTTQARYIDDKVYPTKWLLEVRSDGGQWTILKDNTAAQTDLPHDAVILEEGIVARYLRLSHFAVPYDQTPCISGLRVFGTSEGPRPTAPQVEAKRTGPLDMDVTIQKDANTTGCLILFGNAPDKLYHSYLTFADTTHIGALVSGRSYWVRVDAFNECGITKGQPFLLEENPSHKKPDDSKKD